MWVCMLTTDWKMTAPTTIAIAVVDVRRNTRLYSCRNEHMQRIRVGESEHESEYVDSHRITSGDMQESVSTVVTQTSHAVKTRDYCIIYTT